ncbi:hypothetical protein ACOZ4I_20340 (plasmid) [Haloarcula salina]|uniref:hypothetical protein n=1 Tax=Haloarcula salina TaxID=1429914 RepID=UPI003C701422
MATIYLAGPIQQDDADPYAWHNAIQDHSPEIDWINPFELHTYNEDEVWDHIDEIIEQDLEEVGNADAVLLRRIDEYNLSGASIEAREAYTKGIPVIVWNDAETELPLFLRGHVDEVYESMEEAVEAVKAAVIEPKTTDC